MRTLPLRPGQGTGGIDPAASLRAAAARIAISPGAPPLSLRPEDLHRRIRRPATRRTILFVVDASESMGDGTTARMAAAKGAVLGLLQDTGRRRDRVGLISFRNREARLLLAPTGSLALARERLEQIAIGGSTPLAAGLAKAWETARSLRGREPEGDLLVILLTDGEANVPLVPGNRIRPELERLSALFRRDAIPSVVLHCGARQSDASRELARAMGAGYRLLEKVRAADLRSVLQNPGEDS